MKNAWFTLILGLLLGFGVGFVVGERQSVKPAGVAARPAPAAQQTLPEGHPPIDGSQPGSAADEQLARQATQIMARLADSPDDPRLMVALGNVFYDGKRWGEARTWYEKALEREPGNADVITDLAVVHRNLGQPESAIELLDEAIGIRADHWQAWHNKAVIFHFDLHRHDEASRVLTRLDEIRASNPNVPDFAELKAAVKSSSDHEH